MFAFNKHAVTPIQFGVSSTSSSVEHEDALPGLLLGPHVWSRFNQCPTSCVSALLPLIEPVPIEPT